MKTKAELIKEVDELLKESNELQVRINAIPDVPVGKTGVIYEAPESGTKVWALNEVGEVSPIIHYSEIWHRELIQGILFHDEESALLAGKVRVVRHRLAGFCAKAWENEGEVIDWGSKQQGKYHLVYDYEGDEVLPSSSVHTKKSAYFLPSCDLTELRASFTPDELKLALTGEL